MPANFIPNTVRRAKAFLPLVTLLLMFAPGVGLHAQATDLHGAATQLTKKLNDDPDVQKIIGEHIVIAPFENINGKGDAVPRILQEMLTTSFIKAKHFKVLERDQLQSALDELHFQLSDLADPAKAKKVGKLAGATYVLLGSISDTGSSTSINARIVSIESGESVAAEDMDIKTGDVMPDVSGLHPALTSPPVATVKPTPPPIDLSAKAIPPTAGQFTGQKSNFGLLGGTKFKVLWRENLGKYEVYSFSAGDVMGNGSSRLVSIKVKASVVEGDTTSLADSILRHISPEHTFSNVVSVQKWDGGQFKQTWESPPTTYASRNFAVRVLPLSGKPAPILFSYLGSIEGSGGLPMRENLCDAWLWNSTTYMQQSFQGVQIANIASAPSMNLVGMNGRQLALLNYSDGDDGKAQITYSEKSSFDNPQKNDVAAADFDGDGNIEIATAVEKSIKDGAQPIEIYSLDGTRKAITTKGYGAKLAVWNPNGSKYPFLVARLNTADGDGKATGGYIYFLQWSGESYDEVWKSNQMDDAVIDMQVCDPKGEGKPGLVILSTDKKGYYLTKIVPAN